MATHSLAFYDELVARKLIYQESSPLLAKRLSEGPIVLYQGFDPTADSLHHGNLLGLITLRRFQEAGHSPILVAGGGTGMIGDPGGRSTERTLLDEATLDANVTAITAQMKRFVSFEGKGAARLVDNREWLSSLSLIEFLRDVGKSFSVGTMMAKDSVRPRISEGGISLTEFCYMALQSLDFRELFERYGCTLQLGGSDQWGNITAGIDFIRRTRGAEVYGLTLPLLTTADGTKIGKSTGGGVWLSSGKTSPFALYQFFLRVEDEIVVDLLYRLTFVDLDTIAEVARHHEEAPETRAAQRLLAHEVLAIVHGKAVADDVERASEALYSGALEKAPAELVAIALEEVPRVSVSEEELIDGVDIEDLLVRAGLVTSKGAARRIVSQGGAYLGGRRVYESDKLVLADLEARGWTLLRRGKREYSIVELSQGGRAPGEKTDPLTHER